jgi:hypothetical protein
MVAGSAWGQYWGRYPSYHASTAGESYARGFADVVRSQGQANLANSAAAINLTEAQRRNIDNREKWTNAYFEMRKSNKEYRDAERGSRPTMEQAVRWAQAGKPKRLSPGELDVVTGKINWPVLLTADRYGPYREPLEALFAERASAGALPWEALQKLDETADQMLADLKGQVREVPQMDYLAAKKFIQSLAYEAKQPSS